MRVLIVTSGSMGDAAPYSGLGARIHAAGHEVTVAAHAEFEHTFTGAGLSFVPLPGDLRPAIPQARSGMSPRALARLLRIARPLVASLGDGIAAAAERAQPDVMLLSALVAPLGYQVAEARGIPWAGVFLQPIAPTGDFGSVLLGGRSIGRMGNRAATAAAMRTSQTLYATPVRNLRRSLGLPHATMAELRSWQDGGRYPTFHGFSPSVVPRPSDWRPQLEVTGYWWPAPREWTMPATLQSFLESGPPPVLVGFGSMTPAGHPRTGKRQPPPADAQRCSEHAGEPEHNTRTRPDEPRRPAASDAHRCSEQSGKTEHSPRTRPDEPRRPAASDAYECSEQAASAMHCRRAAAVGGVNRESAEDGWLAEVVRDAVRRAGVRAVIQSGWADLSVAGSDQILTIGEAPHDQLLPHMAAIVHHAGAGTTAAGLRAGIPAVPVPVLADQPFWATRLHHLGAASTPIPARKLTAETLAAAITEVTHNPHRRARAQTLASRLATEDGPARIINWLATL